MQEARAHGHVELSATETTRPLERNPIAAVAQLLARGEGAAHALLEPAATAGPGLPHAFHAEDQLGNLAVVGTGAPAVEGDKGIAKQ